jgi:hypothetical protein
MVGNFETYDREVLMMLVCSTGIPYQHPLMRTSRSLLISASGQISLEQFLKCDDRRQAMEAESISSE